MARKPVWLDQTLEGEITMRQAQKYQADMTSWLQNILGLLYNYIYYIICKLSDICGNLNPVDNLVSQILPRCSLRTCKTRESSPY